MNSGASVNQPDSETELPWRGDFCICEPQLRSPLQTNGWRLTKRVCYPAQNHRMLRDKTYFGEVSPPTHDIAIGKPQVSFQNVPELPRTCFRPLLSQHNPHSWEPCLLLPRLTPFPLVQIPILSQFVRRPISFLSEENATKKESE